MRNRTELVTTQLEGSEFEDESDFEDSEEDWKPAKGEQKPRKIKTGRTKKLSPKASKKRTRKPAKKRKKDSSIDESASDSDPSSHISPKKKSKIVENETILTSLPDTSAELESLVKAEPTTSVTPIQYSKIQPLQRKSTSTLRSFPDKCGFLNLYIFKGDLKDGIINNTQVCLWRRDGSSLLQKYLRDKTVDSDIPRYNSSMVYSCWEDKRADEYLEVKVRCIEQTKQVRVELTNVEELEGRSRKEYEDYVNLYGIPPVKSDTAKDTNSNASNDYEHDDDSEDGEDEVADGIEAEESEETAEEE